MLSNHMTSTLVDRLEARKVTNCITWVDLYLTVVATWAGQLDQVLPDRTRSYFPGIHLRQ